MLSDMDIVTTMITIIITILQDLIAPLSAPSLLKSVAVITTSDNPQEIITIIPWNYPIIRLGKKMVGVSHNLHSNRHLDL